MRFISWGDFTIPFDWASYWVKHFYMWSFQSGTPNPDGVIRLPGRVLNFMAFGLGGNLGAGYFYLFSSLIVAFISFFLFARKFLQIKQTSVQIIGALFFAFNPIFLGNLAKVGLVLAAAMLPLCLLAVRAAFTQRRFRYLLLYIIFLNLSFLHPYTFTVNTVVSGLYLAWMAWQNRAWVFDTWPKFLVIGLFGLAVNLYFALPLANMGTVSKDVISTNITPTPVDYTSLVDVSNTGDLFTGFSLSKNVFVDFAFYTGSYQNVYFFAVFLFYVILFGLYLYTEKRLRLTDKRRLGVLFGGFLLLLLLAATTVAHVDTLIKLLIGMPGGWAFRSPLKWQLYIPLTLFGILVVLLSRVPGKVRLWIIEAVLIGTFVVMNGFLVLDIYQKILIPRTPQYFATLNQKDLDGRTLLLVNNGACMDFMRTYPAVTTELNQIFGSKNVQVKHVLEDSIDSVNLGSYDYVMGCEEQSENLLTKQFGFKLTDHYVDDTFRLYTNSRPQPTVAVTDHLFALPADSSVGDKYRFATDELGSDFAFLTDDQHPATSLADPFEDLSPRNISPGAITAAMPAGQQLRARQGQTVYYKIDQNKLTVSGQPRPDLQVLTGNTLDLTAQALAAISLEDPGIQTSNLVSNGSLEQGLWQGTVGDCYAYDSKPVIGMRLSTADKTAGHQALELSARSHIACTGPNDIEVTGGQHYLLSFDYRSPDGGKYAGFYVSFDDPDETVISQRMTNKDNSWQTFGKELAVPEGTKHLHLLLYAFPDAYGDREHIARYDQISLTPIPVAANRFYVVGQPQTKLHLPEATDYQTKTPARKVVQIKGATQPFYLTTNETYHRLWQAEVIGKRPRIQLPFEKRNAVAQADHLQLNGTMNAWYIDPAKLCHQGNGCTQNSDGSYDFTLAVEFTPQRWFYFGATISLAALAAGLAYYLYDRRQGEQHKEGRWRWHR
ncbi:MAG TPA: hypothetical protein VL737_04480 [Candidatus Pristimantibacillus sp.]|nr:hypothetical protein [Candidatus Pristimantibacillus sp.]